MMGNYKKLAKKFWHFIWEDDSLASWIVTAVLAFILIKFLVYPGLGFLLGTSHPIVAVVSGSMEHKAVPICIDKDLYGNCKEYTTNRFGICGLETNEKGSVNLDRFYELCGDWYIENKITKEQFENFRFKNGFNTGDIMILWRKSNIEVGDTIVFNSNSKYDPIIHRVVEVKENTYRTKGDHNVDSSGVEQNIPHDLVIGEAVFRLPWLGYVKIIFVKMVTFISNLVR